MTVTDLQVMDVLESTGPSTAGQLADLTGLTTGAITGMLNRLEEAGLVRRERDESDARRVIVRLAPGKEEMHEIGSIFASFGKAWDDLASHYDGEQRVAEVTLSVAIPWRIVIQGGAAEITAELGGLDLAGLEVKGGLSMIRLELPAPSGVVPIRISGGASNITIRRPAGIAARVH